MMKYRHLTLISALATVIAVSGCGSNSGTSASQDIHLDYAFYSPLSLVVRDQHLLENRGYNVTWVLSAGSNKANEGLRSKALDVGSTAGSAAMVARANGSPIKAIDLYAGVSGRPWWSPRILPSTPSPT